MGVKYALEWDHVFPYSVLKNNGFNPNNRLDYALMQEITNRAIITQLANRTKSTRLAKDYLAWVEDRFPGSLQKQCIPMDRELWKLENYHKFLEARRKLLSDELNAFLAGITETTVSEVETSVEDMIIEGESKGLEFKSSLRWDYKESKINSVLEKVIMKSIAAFSNADGGTLLIGVNDEGDIIGLEPDYASLKGTKDEFELHLRNLVNKNMGKVFSANSLNVEFHVSNGNEICKIDIRRGEKPLFIENIDKNGVKSKKFYVRSGNLSQELQIDEASEYIKTRFNDL
jgi:hypothetical protein